MMPRSEMLSQNDLEISARKTVRRIVGQVVTGAQTRLAAARIRVAMARAASIRWKLDVREPHRQNQIAVLEIPMQRVEASDPRSHDEWLARDLEPSLGRPNSTLPKDRPSETSRYFGVLKPV